ncbi:MAG: glutamate--tRNA ligase [Clostridiales Family XIII bacterium]|jgi:glutamyl-tRNA synthetase|nr:glutamate--tRNA ligase [Clostridiales Family XIII bacterium]
MMNNTIPDVDYYAALADLLFPFAKSGADIEAVYPPRGLPDGAYVTRLGPSPTGFVHLGNLFMATVNRRLAVQSGGVFFLRIEDTDRKREVDGAVESLLSSLAYFGVGFAEGAAADGEKGDYGPYRQSERREIYHAFVRGLVASGLAYPCFLSEDQITAIRAEQEARKELPGIYGKYAEWRDADIALIGEYLAKEMPFVIRLNADACTVQGSGETVTIIDGIRGEITFPRNILDVVILKQDGLPTYHFAHTIDDHLMRTTHVVRGEEWLSSLPIHIALFEALDFTPPTYCHTALLMKVDDGVKRKLSKRLDPELSLSYYIAEGYHPKAVEEYLLTILNSNYEEWRLSNPGADNTEFTLTTEKMGASGILVDLDKLRDVSRDTLAGITAKELADFMIDWVSRERPDALPVLTKDRAILEAALDIGRSGEKPRKDLEYAAQIFEHISYFFDEYFQIKDPLPEHVGAEDARTLLEGYHGVYDQSDGREIWFGKIRALAEENGYAARPKDYKKNPELYKGHVGDVSAVIRLALTGRLEAPDIWEIQQILGEVRTRGRLRAFERV